MAGYCRSERLWTRKSRHVRPSGPAVEMRLPWLLQEWWISASAQFMSKNSLLLFRGMCLQIWFGSGCCGELLVGWINEWWGMGGQPGFSFFPLFFFFFLNLISEFKIVLCRPEETQLIFGWMEIKMCFGRFDLFVACHYRVIQYCSSRRLKMEDPDCNNTNGSRWAQNDVIKWHFKMAS